MRLRKLVLLNFRGYKERTEINFNDLTVFVGRNDVGKSTILEALDIFFNEGKGAIKLDKGDANVDSASSEYCIGVTFDELPLEIVLDSSYKTTLSDEYLLNSDGNLEVIKKYNGSKCSNTVIRAQHPNNPNCSDLLLKKSAELRKIINDRSISCENQNTNAIMRQSIWNYYRDDLHVDTKDIDVTKGDDTKRIWNKLSLEFPVYSLFQADRQNTDGDKEVQDPLKAAVAQFFQDTSIQEKLSQVAEQVEKRLREVSDRTLSKLREMDSNVADSLNPVIPSVSSLKWADVFKNVSITSDDDIPINKRGSGVKRLILLNFFRAEAERRQEEGDNTGIIYAIEEPETSQHFSNQKVLIKALVDLSKATNTQVILTTHSGVMVKELHADDLRLVTDDENGVKYVTNIERGLLVYPSLNEVNYTAFGEVTEEYHNELYGFIEKQGLLNEYESGKTQRSYIREGKNGKSKQETRTLSHYIRDVMHHPENTRNARYTYDELKESVECMRDFIKSKGEIDVWLDDEE